MRLCGTASNSASPAALGAPAAPVLAALPFLLLWAAPSTALSQVGVKAGVALSGYRATHSDERVWSGEDYRPFLGYEVDLVQDGDGLPDIGLQIGACHTITLFGPLALQPELYFSQRGVRWEQRELYNTFYHLNVSYLQAPVLLRYQPFPAWAVRPSLLLGPYGGLRLTARRTIDIWGARDSKPVPNVRAFDYGLVSAVDVEFPAWSRVWMVELRFEWGLAGTLSPREDFTDLHESPGRVHLVALGLLIGHRF